MIILSAAEHGMPPESKSLVVKVAPVTSMHSKFCLLPYGRFQEPISSCPRVVRVQRSRIDMHSTTTRKISEQLSTPEVIWPSKSSLSNHCCRHPDCLQRTISSVQHCSAGQNETRNPCLQVHKTPKAMLAFLPSGERSSQRTSHTCRAM